MLGPDEATEEFHNAVHDWDLRGAAMTKGCAFPCLPEGYEDYEPTMFREVEVTLRSQTEMEVSAQATSLSALETSIGTKEVVVLLPLEVLKIKLKDPRNLHWFYL